MSIQMKKIRFFRAIFWLTKNRKFEKKKNQPLTTHSSEILEKTRNNGTYTYICSAGDPNIS